MKNTTRIGFTLLVGSLLVITSCTKETTVTKEYNPNIAAIGFWKVVSAKVASFKYLRIGSDKVTTLYMEQTGFKSWAKAAFVPYPDQLLMDLQNFGYSQVYNYRTSGDSLIISDGSGDYISAVKGTEADVAGWVTNVSVTDKIENLFTNLYSGIGFDGTNLLVPDYSNGKIHSVSPVTKNIVSSLGTSTSLNTVEYDGTQYWVGINGYDELTRIKIADGSILGSSIALGPWIYGIGYLSSTQIAAWSNNENTLYMYNPTTNAIAFSKEIDGFYFRDIAVYNGKVYITYSGMVYRLDPAGFVVEKTYSIEGVQDILGIASVGGGDFWIMSNSGGFLGKVNLN